jgi:Domain of unknown function (DUF4352)
MEQHPTAQQAPQYTAPQHTSPTKKGMSRGKIIGLIIIGLIILFYGIDAISHISSSPSTSSTTSTTSNTTQAQQQPTTPTTPGINQPSRDGKFEFTATTFKCGVLQLAAPDNEYVTATAKGQFCTLSLNIKNIGDQAQTFDSSSQDIYDSSERQYSYDSGGTIAANPTNGQCIYPSINPGVSISCTVAYDIPKTVVPTYAMLHDSSASNGVRVNLQ